MKKGFITITAAILVLVLGGCNSNKSTKGNDTNNTQVLSENSVTTVPSSSVSSELSVTPVPSNKPIEESNRLYPAIQIIQGETKYGYIDPTGNFVIEPQYNYASDFNDGVAEISFEEIKDLIDEDGAFWKAFH